MRHISILCFLVFSFSLFSQQIAPTVMSNGGHYQKAGSFSLEWTLGEWVTETIKGSANTITQGFHQTNLTVVATSNPGISGLEFYPNPFESVLRVSNASGSSLTLHLLNQEGKCITSTLVEKGSQDWNLQSLPAGVYFLEAQGKDQRQSFTIEKIK